MRGAGGSVVTRTVSRFLICASQKSYRKVSISEIRLEIFHYMDSTPIGFFLPEYTHQKCSIGLRFLIFALQKSCRKISISKMWKFMAPRTHFGVGSRPHSLRSCALGWISHSWETGGFPNPSSTGNSRFPTPSLVRFQPKNKNVFIFVLSVGIEPTLTA